MVTQKEKLQQQQLNKTFKLSSKGLSMMKNAFMAATPHGRLLQAGLWLRSAFGRNSKSAAPTTVKPGAMSKKGLPLWAWLPGNGPK